MEQPSKSKVWSMVTKKNQAAKTERLNPMLGWAFKSLEFTSARRLKVTRGLGENCRRPATKPLSSNRPFNVVWLLYMYDPATLAEVSPFSVRRWMWVPTWHLGDRNRVKYKSKLFSIRGSIIIDPVKSSVTYPIPGENTD